MPSDGAIDATMPSDGAIGLREFIKPHPTPRSRCTTPSGLVGVDKVDENGGTLAQHGCIVRRYEVESHEYSFSWNGGGFHPLYQ
jgi:hypothetical protein